MPAVAAFLVMVLAIIELFRGQSDRKIRKRTRYIILLFLVLIFLVNVDIVYQSYESEKMAKLSGKIDGKLTNKNIVYPTVNFGGAKFVLQGGSNVLPFSYKNGPLIDDPLDVWIENGELKISTNIRDESRNIIATLDSNEWQVNRNNYFDRNYDKKAVEVINNKGEVVLQAEFTGEYVNFAGVFYREDGWKVAVGPAPDGDGGLFEIRPPNESLQYKFERLFRYPSDEHFGERI